MRLNLCVTGLVVSSLLASCMVYASDDDTPFNARRSSKLYYNLEGANTIPPAPTQTTITLRMRGKGMGYSCGQFDPATSIKNGFNSLRDSVDDAETTIIAGASGALASLPMYILQRAYPDLASELRSKKAEWTEKFNLSLKSCEQYEADALAGNTNPYGDWVNLAKMAGYEEAAEENDGDAVQAKEKVEKGEAENICPNWIGGEKAGCERTEPIHIVKDVVSAGYMQMAGIEPSLNAQTQANSAAKGTHLQRSLGTVSEATAFANAVLGENVIKTQGDDAGPKTTPGGGLLKQLEDEQELVTEALTNVLDNGSEEIDDWNAITAPTSGITKELIDSYHQLLPHDKRLAKSALRDEISFARIVDKALMLRRTLFSGLKEPNVYNSPANDEVRKSINELNDYINDLMFERRIRKELLTSTAKKIINHVEAGVESNVDTRRPDTNETPSVKKLPFAAQLKNENKE